MIKIIKNFKFRAKSKLIVFSLFIAVFIGFFVITASPVVISDGYCYYHIARSVVDKGSFISDTKPDYYDYRGHVIVFDGKVYKDVCSPGTSFVLVPGLIVSKLIQNPALNQYNDFFIAYSGHQLSDGLAILATSLIFAVISVIYFYKLAKLFIKSSNMSLLISATLIISSYVVDYFFLKPFYTHTYEFFAGVIFLYNIVKFNKSNSYRNLVAAAIVGSFGFTVRPFFALPVAFFGIYLLLKRKWKTALVYALCNLPFIFLWFGYNYVSYGNIITSGYNEVRGENFDFHTFNLLPLLFSPWKGWLIWSPFVIVGFVGFFIKIKRKVFDYIDFISLATIIFTVVGYSFWPAWWGGGSYGARFMIINFPFLLPGVAYIYENYYVRWHLILKLFIFVCIIYSSFYSVLYLITPNDSPRKMVAYHIQNASLILKDPLNYIADSRYKADMEFGLIDILIGRAKDVVKIDDRTPDQITFLGFDYTPGQVNKITKFDVYTKDLLTGKASKLSFDISKLCPQKQLSAVVLIDGEKLISTNESIIKVYQDEIYPSSFKSDEFSMYTLDNNHFKVFMPNNIEIKFIGPNKAGISSTGYYN